MKRTTSSFMLCNENHNETDEFKNSRALQLVKSSQQFGQKQLFSEKSIAQS